MVDKDIRHLSELEAEAWELKRTRGCSDQSFEQRIIFGLTGMSSLLILFFFGWVWFKLVWFNWMGMPGWW